MFQPSSLTTSSGVFKHTALKPNSQSVVNGVISNEDLLERLNDMNKKAMNPILGEMTLKADDSVKELIASPMRAIAQFTAKKRHYVIAEIRHYESTIFQKRDILYFDFGIENSNFGVCERVTVISDEQSFHKDSIINFTISRGELLIHAIHDNKIQSFNIRDIKVIADNYIEIFLYGVVNNIILAGEIRCSFIPLNTFTYKIGNHPHRQIEALMTTLVFRNGQYYLWDCTRGLSNLKIYHLVLRTGIFEDISPTISVMVDTTKYFFCRQFIGFFGCKSNSGIPMSNVLTLFNLETSETIQTHIGELCVDPIFFLLGDVFCHFDGYYVIDPNRPKNFEKVVKGFSLIEILKYQKSITLNYLRERKILVDFTIKINDKEHHIHSLMFLKNKSQTEMMIEMKSLNDDDVDIFIKRAYSNSQKYIEWLLKSGNRSDISLISSTTSFKAHKLILALDSIFCRKMFITFGTLTYVNLVEYDEISVHNYLTLVYSCDTYTVLVSIRHGYYFIEEMLNLYALADYLQNSILKKILIDFMLRNIREGDFLKYLTYEFDKKVSPELKLAIETKLFNFPKTYQSKKRPSDEDIDLGTKFKK